MQVLNELDAVLSATPPDVRAIERAVSLLEKSTHKLLREACHTERESIIEAELVCRVQSRSRIEVARIGDAFAFAMDAAHEVRRPLRSEDLDQLKATLSKKYPHFSFSLNNQLLFPLESIHILSLVLQVGGVKIRKSPLGLAPGFFPVDDETNAYMSRIDGFILHCSAKAVRTLGLQMLSILKIIP